MRASCRAAVPTISDFIFLYFIFLRSLASDGIEMPISYYLELPKGLGFLLGMGAQRHVCVQFCTLNPVSAHQLRPTVRRGVAPCCTTKCDCLACQTCYIRFSERCSTHRMMQRRVLVWPSFGLHCGTSISSWSRH